MTSRTIAIGDIHGCSAALRALLDVVQPAKNERFILLGDYVDRGPDSCGVMEILLGLEGQCELVPVLGNHELMMLHGLESEEERGVWLYYGGEETLASYGGSVADVPNRHVEFLRRCRPYWETEHHFFVHANYAPTVPLADQPELVRYWTHLTEAIPPAHQSQKTAILGHTPQRNGEVLDLGHLICLDTYCFGGGWLTAMDVESGEVWQANLIGEIRAPGSDATCRAHPQGH